MYRYVCLIKFTNLGAQEITDSTARARSFHEVAEKAGVKIELQYWLLGGYDGVLVLNAETEESALHCLTELAASGKVRTETYRAFDENEFNKIVTLRSFSY